MTSTPSPTTQHTFITAGLASATPGLDEYDPHTRLLRACALICVEKRAWLNSDSMAPNPGNNWPALLAKSPPPSLVKPATRVKRFRRALETAADHVYEEWIEPSAALWVLRMREEQALLTRGDYQVTMEHVDTILQAGQARCPWSKEFLLEAAKNRESDFGAEAGVMEERDCFMAMVNDADMRCKIYTQCPQSELEGLMADH
jgi:hypothetical protein